MVTTTPTTHFTNAAPGGIFSRGQRRQDQVVGTQTEPNPPERQRRFFDKMMPAKTGAHKPLAPANQPAPSASGGKPHVIKTFGGRRLWRNAQAHANQHKNIRATLDALAAGVLYTAGVGVHYTSKAVSAAIRYTNQNKRHA
jgi:hypothetical protein